MKCRGCGCTDLTACTLQDGGPCWWVGEDLCSGCAVGESAELGDDDDGGDDGFAFDASRGLFLPDGHDA